MIRLIIVEMEETLIDIRASTARTMADQKEMRRQVGRLETLQSSWTEKAELALSKNREDLAKDALAEKQQAADMDGQIESEIKMHDNAIRASDFNISQIETKMR